VRLVVWSLTPAHVRSGAINLVLTREPLRGGARSRPANHASGSKSSSAAVAEFCFTPKDLVGVQDPRTVPIVLVREHFNTHALASLLHGVSVGRNHALGGHPRDPLLPNGSWQTMAMIEVSGLPCEGLNRRLTDRLTLADERRRRGLLPALGCRHHRLVLHPFMTARTCNRL
jgi:hypothetical protein